MNTVVYLYGYTTYKLLQSQQNKVFYCKNTVSSTLYKIKFNEKKVFNGFIFSMIKKKSNFYFNP